MLRISMRFLLQILLLIGAITGAASSVIGQQPTTGFAEPVIRIGVGANEGTATVNLKSRVQPSTPLLEDFPLPQPAATVKFSPLEGTQPTQSNTWRYRVDITGLLPTGVTQQRYAKVTYADQTSETFSYMVSNQAASAFSWAISKPPDPWATADFSWSPTCTSFSVTPKDSVATEVKITSTLVEQTTKAAITSDKLRLCKGNVACKDDERIELPANSSTALMLCTTETFHGTYTGAVNLTAREKPEGEAILQKAQLSSFIAKLMGFIVIVLGVFIAFLAKVYARARLERNQALLPAIEMRVQLESLRSRLESIDQEYASLCVNIRNLITSLLEELSTEELDRRQLIPPKLPTLSATARDNAALKQYLESRNPAIQLIATLIKDGIVKAVGKDTGTLPPELKDRIKAAVRDIDAIASASPLPTSSQALPLILAILARLETELESPPGEPERPLTAVQEFNVVSLEIETISKGIWILYSLLTALAGLAVLVLNNPGFGTPLDFVYAFFWGFGLPITVTSLAPGSVATALNISIART